MRIGRISIEAVRSHTRRLDLDLSSSSINLLYGPNGSGKSSVLTALHHAFLAPHDSTSAALTALVPWGTSLAPSVEVTFTHRGEEYRLRKQFLHSPVSILERRSAAGWQPIAKGKQADAQIREFLGAAPGGKAAQDRLLASVLWTQQGALALASVSPNVHSAIAEQLDSPAAQRLSKWIDGQAANYWTPTSRVQKNSPAARLATELAALEARQSALRAELGAIAALRDEIVALERSHAEAESAATRAKAELDHLGQSISQSTLLRQQRESLVPLIASKSKQVDLISAAAQSVERAQSDLATLRPEYETLAAQAGPDLDARLDGLSSKLAAANSELLSAHSCLALQTELTALETRLTGLRTTQSDIAGLEGELRGLSAPTADQLAVMKSSAAELARLETALGSASLRLEVVAQRPLPIEIVEGDQPGTHSLDPVTPQFFTASPKLRFSIAGVGEFSITGPASSAAKLKSEIRQTAEQRHQLAAVLGSSDIDELDRRLARATEIEIQLKSLRAALVRDAAGQSEADLQSRLLGSMVALESHYSRHPAWRSLPPDPAVIQDSIAPLAADAAALGDLKNRLSALAQSIESASGRVSGTLAQHAAATLDNLRRSESSLRTELAGLNDQLARTDAGLAAFPPDLASMAERLAAESDESGRLARQSIELLQLRRGQLDEKLSKAPASDLGDVEAELSALAARLQREQLEAQAWLLLRGTAAECRERMIENIASPAAERASEILARIGAAQLGPVHLTPSLEPAPLAPPGAPDPVTLDQISGGEAEQVHFAARLALAELLARDEPQLAVFDDVLLSTDDARLGRLLALLEDSLDHLQILILTCHSERYTAHLKSAHRMAVSRN